MFKFFFWSEVIGIPNKGAVAHELQYSVAGVTLGQRVVTSGHYRLLVKISRDKITNVSIGQNIQLKNKLKSCLKMNINKNIYLIRYIAYF